MESSTDAKSHCKDFVSVFSCYPLIVFQSLHTLQTLKCFQLGNKLALFMREADDMNKKKWTTLFIRYGKKEAAEFYALHKDQMECTTVSGPIEGLTMIKVREHAQNSLFYLGEVRVTETKLRHGKEIGLGVVKGDEPELSTALAFIDLCFKTDQFTDTLNNILSDLEDRETEAVHKKTQEILRTKVNFDMMND